MKFIKTLSATEKQTLEEVLRNHPHGRVRPRAQALLLSARGYTISQIRSIFEVQCDTVSAWFDKWDQKGIVGLFDEMRSGRPSIYTDAELAKLKTYVDENPHQLKVAAARLQEETRKEASLGTYKRCLKKSSVTGGSAAGVR